MSKTGPAPIDTQEFQFKLHCRFKVFDYQNDNCFSKPCNLVVAASRYGLIFCGSTEASFQVFELKTIENASLKDGEIKDYERRTIPLPSCPQFISVNCDCTKLAVVVQKNGCPVAIFYDVISFLKEGVVTTNEIRLSLNPSVNVVDVSWNPAIPGIFTACKSDGTLGVYEFKQTGIEINELPIEARATSMCWSPKGKQLAVGDQSGKITQYKPDLKAARIIEGPSLNPVHSVISLQWISNFQFIAVYKSAAPDSQALLMVVDAPKTGAISYTNYDDICYSNGTARPPQFYMIFQQHWNVLMIASSNSMEVGVMGAEKEQWTQWLLDDASRAELPLSNSRQDTLPVGMALDTGSTEPIPFGENTLPPAPYLLLLSHYGLLLCFKVINLISGAPTICSPPDPLADQTGLKYFVKGRKLEEDVNQQKAAGGGIPKQLTHSEPTPAAFAPAQNQPNLSSGNSTPFVLTPTPQNKTSDQAIIKSTEPSSQSQIGFGAGSQASFTFTPPVQPKPIDSVEKKSETPIQTQSLFGQKSQSLFTTKSQPLFTGGSLFASQTSVPSTQYALFGTPVNKQVTTPASSISLTNFASTTDKQSLNETKSTTALATTKPTTPLSKLSGDATQVQSPSTKTSTESFPSGQEEIDALIAKMVREECESLEAELKALLHKAREIKVDLGSDEEITQMLQYTDSLQEFVKEVMETSDSQAAEVHYLKQSVIQAWAWYEEAQSRYAISKDSSMTILQRSQPLDPASKRQLEDIRHILHYLESQLVQASAALDERWEAFQDSCKKTLKLKVPTMETVFQAMVKQNGILQKQKYVLKDIANRIHTYRSKNSGSTLLLSLDNVEALENQLQLLQLQPESALQMQYERVMKKTENFTKTKVEKLRNLLKNQKVSHVGVSKPQLSGSFMQTLLDRSSSEKQQLGEVRKTLFPEKLTTLLNAEVSPLPSEKDSSKSYMPIQSTPKLEPAGLLRSKTMPASSLIFSPVAKTSEAATAAAGFNFTPQKSSSLAGFHFNTDKTATSPFNLDGQTSTMPKNTSIFTSSQNKPTELGTLLNQANKGSNTSLANQALTMKATVAPTTPNSKIISFGTPNSTMTSTIPISDTNSLKFGIATSAQPFAGSKPISTVNSTKFTFTPSSDTKEGNVGITSTSSLENVFVKVPSSSSFSFGSAFAPTTDSGNVFAAKGGSLFGSTSITPVQQAKTSASTTSFFFNATNNTLITSIPASKSSDSTPTVSTNVPMSSGIGTFGSTNSFGISANSNLFGKTTTASSFNFGNAFSAAMGKANDSEKPIVTTATNATASTEITKLESQSKPSSIPGGVSHSFSSTALSSSLNTDSFSIKSSIQDSQSKILENSSVPAAAAEAPSMALPVITAVEGSKTEASVFSSTTASVTQSLTTSTASEKSEVSSTTTDISITKENQCIVTSLVVPSATNSSVFANTTPIIQKVQTSSPTVFAAKTTSSSLFGTSVMSTGTPSITSGAPIFGSIVSQPTAVTSTSQGFGSAVAATQTQVFDSSTATAPVFGSPTITSSVLSAPVTTTSTFGVSTTTSTVFGAPATTTAMSSVFTPTTSSIFGTQTTASSVFGTPITATTASSLFGAPTATTASSVFGVPTTSSIFGTQTSASSGFSVPPATSPAFGSAPVFGSKPFGATTTATTVFGSGGTQSTTGTLFGSTPAFGSSSAPFGGGTAFGAAAATTTTTTTSSSVFGQPSAFGNSGGSLFSGTPASSSSIFGGTPTGGFTTGGSLFGTPTSATSPFGAASTTQSVFGSPVTTQSAFGSSATTQSIFGSSANAGVFGTPASSQSIFGSPPASQSSFSFASAAANVPSSTSAFGFPQKSAFGSGFGSTNATTNANSFSFGSVNLGTTTAASSGFGSTFGQTQNPFAAKPADQKPAFGTGGSLFGKPATPASTSSIFGGGSSNTFGSTSSFGQSPSGFGSNSAFGQQPTFGQTAFGGSSAFGSGSQTSGVFSSGSGSVAQSGFGFGQQQKPAFGSSPVFGSNPAFGSTPAFGSAPVFGGSPGFGSPPKVFGANTPAAVPAFGSPTQQNATFASLANQNIGFGALAQQQNTATSSSTSSFSGGSSFSSWRS